MTAGGRRLKFLILEDSSDRFEQFESALRGVFEGCEIKRWASAHQMIEALDAQLADATLISLDHDLYPTNEAKDDPGDGVDTARALATQQPVCPIIIHSSNSDRADQMQGILELEGWQVYRVLPFGGEWVVRDWLVLVQQLLFHSR